MYDSALPRKTQQATDTHALCRAEGSRHRQDTLCDPKFMKVLFSLYVTSDSLPPHGLQHAVLHCSRASLSVTSSRSSLKLTSTESVTPPTISSSVVPLSSRPQSFPASGSSPVSRLLASGGQKYWSFSFSISPSNEYSGLISFRIDWSDVWDTANQLLVGKVRTRVVCVWGALGMWELF